ncbi:hypothetical protein [Staphylococcus phage vB_ScaM-V1SC01]|nr:hypothetical protein [Staphylococcus phage vB_ScaM-V1SC01]WPF67605.1 hypothetical protein [Staphylococcus phage vB_SauM-V1SA12]
MRILQLLHVLGKLKFYRLRIYILDLLLIKCNRKPFQS